MITQYGTDILAIASTTCFSFEPLRPIAPVSSRRGLDREQRHVCRRFFLLWLAVSVAGF